MRKTGRRLAHGGWIVAALVALGVFACGSGESELDGLDLDRALAPAAVNRPPEIHSVRLEPASPQPGSPVTLVVDSSDPDGDSLQLLLQWKLDGRRIGHGEPVLIVPEGTKGARLELLARVHDGNATSPEVRAVSTIANRPPKMLELMLEPAGDVTVQDQIQASPRAEDPDGDPLEYSYGWRVNGRPVRETGPVIAHPHFRRGDLVELTVRVSDGEDESDALRSPSIQVLNSPPSIVSMPLHPDATGAFRYKVRVEDPDGDRRLRFRLLSGPSGMTLDWLSGALAWVPQEDQAGKHRVEIEVEDQAGGTVTQSFDLDVGFAPVETPPAAPSS